MNLTYQDNLKDVSWLQICQIFESVGWGERNPEEIEKAFKESSYVRIVRDNSKIVAFGRTVDDGRYYALIVDLVIDTEYQGKGIGKKILSELRNELESYYFTTLTTATGKDEFYLKQGWQRQSSSFIFPRTDKQKKEHTKS